jgi:glyoxylase-like metal-dependent hydrolase (beta-lactamase superfamily II)
MATRAENPRPLDRGLLAPIARDPTSGSAHELSPGFWALQLPLPYAHLDWVNCYLLERREGWLLIDCGVERDALFHALRLAGVEPRAVTTLLLSHLHCDHALLARDLVAEIGCEVVVGPGPLSTSDRLRDAGVPLDERRRAAFRDGVPAAEVDLIVDARIGEPEPWLPPAPDRRLAPGDEVETETARWRVAAAPGHSPNQITLFDARERRLIAADLGYAARPFLEWGAEPDPVRSFRGSLRAAEALEPTTLFCGHGRPEIDAASRFAGAEAALDRLLAFVRGSLGTEPVSAYEVTLALVGHSAHPDGRQATLATVLCALEHLVGHAGEAAEVTGEDGRRRFRAA